MCALVFAKPHEDIEVLIKRFSMACEKEGTLAVYRQKMYFMAPSVLKHMRNCKLKHLKKINKK